jgi:hypothetical protein
MIRLHCNIGRHIKAGAEVADDDLVEAFGEKFVQDLVDQKLAERVPSVVVYGDDVTPEFAQALAQYVEQMTGLADRLVVVLDLAAVGTDAEAIALVDAIREHRERMGEVLGPKVDALFHRAIPADLADLNNALPGTAQAAAAQGVGDGSASSNGASSGAADTTAAPTNIPPKAANSTSQAPAAAPVEQAAKAPAKAPAKAKKPAADKAAPNAEG